MTTPPAPTLPAHMSCTGPAGQSESTSTCWKGATPVLAMLPGLRQDGWWLDDTMAQGGILLDLGRKVLLFFAWEGPSTELRHRAAMCELIRAAWPGPTQAVW